MNPNATGSLRGGRRAALLAAVAPVALYAAPAFAAPNCSDFWGCADGVVTPNGGHFNYTYTFTSSNGGVDRIEIAELQAGEFTSSGGVYAGSAPPGWQISEQATSFFGFYLPDLPPFNATAAPPGAYLEITSTEGALWPFSDAPNVFSLTLESPFGATMDTNFFVNPIGGSMGAEGFAMDPAGIDPPTPLPPSSVPEPATLGLFGVAMAGLAGIRRRRRV